MTTKFARVADIKVGDTLIPDGGFICLTEGAAHVVKTDGKELFITCTHGKHYLNGQRQGGVYIGLTKKEA